jgi:hypothetical protein
VARVGDGGKRRQQGALLLLVHCACPLSSATLRHCTQWTTDVDGALTFGNLWLTTTNFVC